MTAFWIAAGVLVALSVGLLLRALARPGPTGAAGHDLAVYRDQLRELERDRARGLIGAAEAEAARTEIERRVLAADAGADAADPRPARRLALVLALVVPAAALALYLQLGQPGLPDAPLAARDGGAGPTGAEIARLESAAAGAPRDAAAWVALGRGYRAARRFADAADAFGRAVELGAAAQRTARGEMLTMAAGGVVTEAALTAFEAARAAGVDDPRIAFYTGLAAAQAGDPHAALARWLPLEARSPADAAWLPALREQIAAAAEEAGLSADDLAGLRADARAAAPGPGEEDIAAAEAMTPEERAAFIEEMVAGLAARLEDTPEDLDGWRRLGRSYMVLGRPAEAADAYARAAELAPESVPVLVDYGEALLAAGDGGARLPGDFVSVMRRVLALDPGNPVALWFVGVAEYEAGDAPAARAHWQTLLDRLPPDAPERAELERRIEAIEAQGG